MRLNQPEIWDPFTSGSWISRKAWKKNYAISLCNLKCDKGTPILMHDTYGFMFQFAGNQTPSVFKRTIPGKRPWLSGLQYDLLADDWYVADQTLCEMTLKERE